MMILASGRPDTVWSSGHHEPIFTVHTVNAWPAGHATSKVSARGAVTGPAQDECSPQTGGTASPPRPTPPPDSPGQCATRAPQGSTDAECPGLVPSPAWPASGASGGVTRRAC